MTYQWGLREIFLERSLSYHGSTKSIFIPSKHSRVPWSLQRTNCGIIQNKGVWEIIFRMSDWYSPNILELYEVCRKPTLINITGLWGIVGGEEMQGLSSGTPKPSQNQRIHHFYYIQIYVKWHWPWCLLPNLRLQSSYGRHDIWPL